MTRSPADKAAQAEAQAQARGRQHRLRLACLFLDPNNYRIIDHERYSSVSSDEVLNSTVQNRTTGMILGENAENVKDLLASYRANGFLPVDQIQVRASVC